MSTPLLITRIPPLKGNPRPRPSFLFLTNAVEEHVGFGEGSLSLGREKFLDGCASKQDRRRLLREPLQLEECRIALLCDDDDFRLPRRGTEPANNI